MLIFVSLLRVWPILNWRERVVSSDAVARKMYLQFILGVLATGLVWSGYVITSFDQMSRLEVISCLVVVAAMSSGAVTVLAPSRKLTFIYMSLLILPIAFFTLLNEDHDLNTLGILALIYWVLMISISQRSHEFVKAAIKLRLENNELLSQSETERKRTEDLNSELVTANKKLDYQKTHLEDLVKLRTEEIVNLSNKVQLTALLNRNGLQAVLTDELQFAQQHQQKVAVLFIDLDGFKQVNDRLGHAIGDGVLVAVAKRITAAMQGALICRWGGDEFIVVITHATEEAAERQAGNIIQRISEAISIADNTVNLGATIGIAMFPDHATDRAELIRRADIAMYLQKRLGRQGVLVFEDNMYKALAKEQTLIEAMHLDIGSEHFKLVYQPIISATNGDLWAVEALLRYEFGTQQVSPMVFIPLAEKTGLILPLGAWVLKKACVDAQNNLPASVKVSINVSVLQLMDDGFLAELDTALYESTIAPSRVHLEITESLFADDKDRIQFVLDELAKRGVAISIDDFGTGYSSLSQLNAIAFNHIKIDKAFVQDLANGNEAIIKAIIMMAKEFGAKTIAEGVETEHELSLLKQLGVNYLQGYYFNKPMPIADLTRQYHVELSELHTT